MSGGQSLQRQVDALRELNAYLQRINGEMSNMVRGYADKIQNLPDSGMTMEFHDEFMREFKTPFQNLVSQSIVLNEQAMQYVGRKMQALEQALY